MPKKIVILGGGTAGWMAANLFVRQWAPEQVEVTLIESPDIGIIGRTDITNKDYEQTAVVSTNVGNIAPVVTAFAAGPQAAAAVFLFSQIFKDPLEDIGTIYYTVTGSWDEPVIESANEEAFARSGELAGCLDNSE